VLDGDALFGGYAQAMANRSGANEVAAALIVGIAGTPGSMAPAARWISPSPT
jgi:hypothetical protein